MKFKLFSLFTVIGLSGCQVTGEKNNIYQKALSYAGTSTKNISLNSTQNQFKIIIPKSTHNLAQRFKGLGSNQNYFSQFNQTLYSDNVWQTLHSSLRVLSDTTSKLKLCNSHFSQSSNRRIVKANSCSEVTLKSSIQDLGQAYQINFEGINVDQHQQSFALAKIEIPNVMNEQGSLNQKLLKATLGYSDQMYFKSRLSFKNLMSKLVNNFNQTIYPIKQNSTDFFYFKHVFSLDKSGTLAPIECLVSTDKLSRSASVDCKYAIFSETGISDYRPYQKQVKALLQQTF